MITLNCLTDSPTLLTPDVMKIRCPFCEKLHISEEGCWLEIDEQVMKCKEKIPYPSQQRGDLAGFPEGYFDRLTVTVESKYPEAKRP